VRDAQAVAPNFLLAGERLKPEWTFRWLLDPAQISPGTGMPTGLFRKEGERWVINLPNPPASANEYQDDHARLLVRYMFLMTADEQGRLLSASPAPAAAAPATQARSAQKRAGNRISSNRVKSKKRGNGVARSGPFRNARSPGL
jgi:hypothetical protein